MNSCFIQEMGDAEVLHLSIEFPMIICFRNMAMANIWVGCNLSRKVIGWFDEGNCSSSLK